MLKKVIHNADLYKLNPLFQDIRFYMGRTALQGLMGEVYADDINNPTFAILIVRRYCFMSGNIEEKELRELIENKLKSYILIPSDNLKYMIEKIFGDSVTKLERYSIKKGTIFDKEKLERYKNSFPQEYNIQKIDKIIASQIKQEEFILITDDYEKNGVGFCCTYNNKIVGIASSNIFYQDGIEVNIKVSEEHRRKGIATALASHLILQCLKENKKITWDAANMNSVGLAQKLGFEYDSTYNIYKFI